VHEPTEDDNQQHENEQIDRETGEMTVGRDRTGTEEPRARRRLGRGLGAAVLSLAGIAGTAGIVGVGLGGSTPAGADTSGYTLTCNGTGTWTSLKTLVLSGVVTTGALPASVTAGSGFTLTGYGLKLSLPATGIFAAAAGATISGTYTTKVTATGATPATASTTLTVPSTTLPKPIPAGGAPLSASGSPVHFTASATPGAISVSTSTSGTLTLTVVGVGAVTLTCTNPATTIASVTGAAPSTKITGVLPNAAPVAGGTTTVISGLGFTGASAVTFGGVPATAYTVSSGGQITATVPAHAPGTVDVAVASPTGTATDTGAFTYTNGPIVTGVSPNYGPKSGGTQVTVTGIQLTGVDNTGVASVAFGQSTGTAVSGVSSTQLTVTSPAHPGAVVDVVVSGPTGNSVVSAQDRFTYGIPGYWTVASDGGVFSYGAVAFYGSMGGQPLNKPIVGLTPTPDGKGYWEVASDGGIFSFGDAQFYGSTGGIKLNQPIVGMAATPTGGGYWLVAKDGGIFAFGNATFYGSAGAVALPGPIVSMVANPTGTGYWEIGATGQVYAFGTPGLYGSMGGRALSAPIVGAASTPDFYGNWLVAADGGIFSFGNAAFYGSMGGKALNKPIVGLAPSAGGTGYWEVASDGGIFAFGTASFYGSMGGQPLNAPMVAIATA
jgi:hypothetical protein